MSTHDIIKAKARAMPTCIVIGDVHGCYDELQDLCSKLGLTYNKRKKKHYPSPARPVVFVGDLVDRGPRNAEVFNLVVEWCSFGLAYVVKGNHDDKFVRWCDGRNVRVNHGLNHTIDEFKAGRFTLSKKEIVDFARSYMPLNIEIDDGKAIVVHAAWRSDLGDGQLRSWALYGPHRGMRSDGYPDRVDWQADRKVVDSSPLIIYGHYAHTNMLPRIINETYGIDTGCVFGGRLTALKYPELEIIQVDARQKYASGKGWE